jgi:hypothetical protein
LASRACGALVTRIVRLEVARSPRSDGTREIVLAAIVLAFALIARAYAGHF